MKIIKRASDTFLESFLVVIFHFVFGHGKARTRYCVEVKCWMRIRMVNFTDRKHCLWCCRATRRPGWKTLSGCTLASTTLRRNSPLRKVRLPVTLFSWTYPKKSTCNQCSRSEIINSGSGSWIRILSYTVLEMVNKNLKCWLIWRHKKGWNLHLFKFLKYCICNDELANFLIHF